MPRGSSGTASGPYGRCVLVLLEEASAWNTCRTEENLDLAREEKKSEEVREKVLTWETLTSINRERAPLKAPRMC